MLPLLCFAGCNPMKKAVRNNIPMLQEKEWHLVAIQQDTINSLYENIPVIVFDKEGNFSGNSSCNQFFGSYFQRGMKLQLTYSGSTKRLCEEMHLEELMMKNLKKDISRFSILDSVLYIYAGKEEVLRFK